MRKEYTIKELTLILGCSRTAIVKKIKEDGANPSIKRYKNRYDVVMSNGQMAILLDDEDLEQEKMLSRGSSNVFNNGFNTVQTDDFIDVEPEKEQNTLNELYNFTERYINEFKTFQETTYNEMRNLASERDTYKNQILLLEDSEKRKESALMETIADNVTLKKHRTMLTVALCVVMMVLASFVTFHITYVRLHNTVATPEENVTGVNSVVIEQKKEPVPQANPKKSVQRAKQVRN